jgi:peptidoglycan/xylan/chitin deacetylase (PgdA/CDA1 family)
MLKHPIISLLISLVVRAVDVISGLFGRRPTRGVVLFYHSVKAEDRARFAKQMDLLLRKAKPVRADIDRLPATAGTYVALTFDDGLECVLENALPEIQKRNIPATIFIVTGTLGGYAGWKDRGAGDALGQKAMSIEQLRKLPEDLITIGSHSVNHAFLPSLEEEELRRELSSSRTTLEQLLNRKVTLFSCPYGGFNASVERSCREAGYERMFTALSVFAFSLPNEFVTGRVRTTATDWPIEFRLKLAGAYRWLPAAIVLKAKVMSAFRKSSANKASHQSSASLGIPEGDEMFERVQSK